MPAEKEPLRPKAVTVIGWLWLVLAVLFLFRAIVNMVVWKILKPDMPSVLRTFGGEPVPLQRFLPVLFEHLTALQTTEAILSAAVIVLAIQLLRLRPWARAGVQVLCWLGIAYLAAFSAFWVWLWGKIAASAPAPATSFERFGLPAGLAVCLAAAAGLAVMIASLRSQHVRDAFRTLPPGSSHDRILRGDPSRSDR